MEGGIKTSKMKFEYLKYINIKKTRLSKHRSEWSEIEFNGKHDHVFFC